MKASDFEGTRVLDKLAAIQQLDAFFAAVESNDFGLATDLMKQAELQPETILLVLSQWAQSNNARRAAVES